MKKIFIEPSAINYLKSNDIEIKSFNEKLLSQDYMPVIGMHTIYELALTFMDPTQKEEGKCLFSIVKDLNSSY